MRRFVWLTAVTPGTVPLEGAPVCSAVFLPAETAAPPAKNPRAPIARQVSSSPTTNHPGGPSGPVPNSFSIYYRGQPNPKSRHRGAGYSYSHVFPVLGGVKYKDGILGEDARLPKKVTI